MINDTLDQWSKEGCHCIEENSILFYDLVDKAREYEKESQYDQATVYCEMAALLAVTAHCGLFASSELERILIAIGKKTMPSYVYPRPHSHTRRSAKRILHVCTSLMPIGGHSRMLRRWIEQDVGNSHSVILTRQTWRGVPEVVHSAVKSSGGKIYKANSVIGSVLSWAKRLRQIAHRADIIVLHIGNRDIVPMIAFANKEQMPPIVYLDHSDHLFWLGAYISDIVVNLRESGMRLSQERRGIEARRNVMLPIPLEYFPRTFSRREAKKHLGFPEESIVLLSIARRVKYRTVENVTYADAHVPVLKKYKNAILVVIGAGNQPDWSSAVDAVNGRIILYGEREDTALFYQAADIYVDSFPFISNTSLLEAGAHGMPVVSRYPYSDACGILGADMPGLTGNLIRVRSTNEYNEILSHLMENEKIRLQIGEQTRRSILETHTGENWLSYLDQVYKAAESVPKLKEPVLTNDLKCLDGPDVFIQRIYGMQCNLDWLIESQLRAMPIGTRLRYWLHLFRRNSFTGSNRLGSIKYIFPEWFLCRVR